MPWRCPACQTQIRHSEAEVAPRPGQVYRCHVCRLELVVDDINNRLTVAPFPTETAADRSPKKKRP